MFTVATWKPKRWHVKVRFGFFETQVAISPQLRAMLEVERKTSNTPQAEVLRFGAGILQRSLNVWIGQKKRLPSCKLAAMRFWHLLESTQYARHEGYLFSQELEWMHMEENHTESAATGSGRGGY